MATILLSSASLTDTLDSLHIKAVAAGDEIVKQSQASMATLNVTVLKVQRSAHESIEALNGTVHDLRQIWQRSAPSSPWSLNLLAWLIKGKIAFLLLWNTRNFIVV